MPISPIDYLLPLGAAVLGLVASLPLRLAAARYPALLDRQWALACKRDFGDSIPVPPDPGYSLFHPGPQCHHCRHRLSAVRSLPLLGYLLSRGRCSHCGQSLPRDGPWLELLCALLCALCAWRFGLSWQLAAAAPAGLLLLLLARIDQDSMILPDGPVFLLLWLGLLVNSQALFTDLVSALWGAVLGYLLLWLCYYLFLLLTGREGLGHGDFKLLAALGAWLGWQELAPLLVLASSGGAIYGLLLMAFAGHRRGRAIPFGPWLAGAGCLMLLWGDTLNRHLLQWLSPAQ